MERVVVDVNETRQTRAARQMYSVTVTRRVKILFLFDHHAIYRRNFPLPENISHRRPADESKLSAGLTASADQPKGLILSRERDRKSVV